MLKESNPRTFPLKKDWCQENRERNHKGTPQRPLITNDGT